MEKIKLAYNFPDARVGALLVDEDHEPGLQVGEEQAEEKGRHDEEHQTLLITECVHECHDAESSVPHAGHADGNKRIITRIVSQFIQVP